MMIFMPIKAVIFDLYRTLIDPSATKSPDVQTHEFLQRKFGIKVDFTTFRKTKEKIYIKYFKQRDTHPFTEIDPKHWWEEIFLALGVKKSDLQDDDLEAVIRLRNEIWMPNTKLYPEVKDLLQQLKQAFKLKLAVITNISRGDFARENMNYLGITGFFDVILTSAESGIRKPNPVIFHDALARLKVKPQEAIFCGDTKWDDIKGAKDAGIWSVLISRPQTDADGHPTMDSNPLYHHPIEIEADHVLEDLRELIPIIEKLNALPSSS